MGTKKIKYKLKGSLIVLLFFSLVSCTKERLYLSKDFLFPVNIFPAKETYKVGDTIDISIQFDKIVEDREKTVKYLFENYNFDAGIRIVKLTTKSTSFVDQPGAIQSFQFINQVGGIFPFGAGGGELILVFSDNNYLHSSKIILRKPGIFAISFLLGSIDTAQLTNPPVGYDQIIAGVGAAYFNVNSGEGLNLHLITQNTASNYDNPSPEEWARPVFAFRVEE
jgi:hypothetical protein